MRHSSNTTWLTVVGFFVLALTAAPAAEAQQGEMRVGGRLISIDTNAETSTLQDTGGTIRFDSAWSLDFDTTWMIGHDWGLEWMITTAPHDLSGNGGSSDGLDFGNVWVAESTITIQYYIPLWGRWRPYAGLGVGLAFLHSANTTDAARTIGIYDLRSDVGIGLAAQVGVSHRLNGSWVVNFDIKYVDMPMDIRLKDADGVTTDRLEADLDPLIIGLGGAFRF